MEISSTMSCRAKSRINASFTVKVRGVDAAGKDYEEDAVLDNLSASGLYVRLLRNLEIDAEVLHSSVFLPATAPRRPRPVWQLAVWLCDRSRNLTVPTGSPLTSNVTAFSKGQGLGLWML